jgi:hypothetical protein
MANSFKISTAAAIGAVETTVYTCPAATQTTLIGMSVANITAAAISVDVRFENNDGDNIYIVKAAPVPVGSSLVVIGGDQKVVMEPSDIIKVTSNAASSADVALSMLEIT